MHFEPTLASARVLSIVVMACLSPLQQLSVASGADRLTEGRREPYWCCGLNCLTVIAHWHGVHVRVKSFEEILRPRDNGDCSVAQIERAARAVGLDPICASVDWNTLRHVPFPCIVQLRSPTRYATGGHYVLLMGLHSEGVILLDAPSPGTVHPYDEFRKDWTGVVIAIPRDENEKRAFVARIGNSPSWTAWAIRGSIVAVLGVLASLLSYRSVLTRRTNPATLLPRISSPFGH